MKKSTLTPWEVSGDINYEKITKEFGASLLKNSELEDINLHPLLRRGLYYSHRNFDSWIKSAKSGKKVSVITGRGPSEKMHIGHLIPFILAKSLQDKFNCNVFIPISEDEKYFVKQKLSFENAQKFADENILDIIALGFNPDKTFIFKDFSYPIYPLAARISKLITYSEAKAIFGLKPESNLGWTFYPAVQATHILFPQFHLGKHDVVVPVGIDQDPFIRLSRDVASHPSLNLSKPCAIHSKFLPGLKGTIKMSSSEEGTNVIYLNDSPKTVKEKINKYAFSGGKDTLEEHRKKGGNPDIDISFLYLKYIFEEDDKKLNEIEQDYRNGKLTSGELKKYLIDKINEFLKNHNASRERAKNQIDKFIL